jgi:hypothetical protein
MRPEAPIGRSAFKATGDFDPNVASTLRILEKKMEWLQVLGSEERVNHLSSLPR